MRMTRPGLAWKMPRHSRARPESRKLQLSMVRRSIRLMMRVAIMQPKTKNRVISAEPREAISPFRLSAPSTLGANECFPTS
ncbi:hypothetical protein D3C85_1624110 [compost metagenome]